MKKYTLEEELANKLSSLNEDPWNINVVRRVFIKTAIEELSGGQPSDFERRLNVKFIGEEGVDGGGLTREFFTLLFEKTGVFEDDGFSYDADLLEKKRIQSNWESNGTLYYPWTSGTEKAEQTIS